METALHSFQDSIFISANAHQLLRRFSLSYRHEFACIDYYVDDLETGLRISKDILFTLDRFENRLVVSRFYPELSHQVNSKYLSATCFYLMIHHFTKTLKVPSSFNIYLNARPSVFQNFYEKLKDFTFQVQGPKSDCYWNLISAIEKTCVDTSMITPSFDVTKTFESK